MSEQTLSDVVERILGDYRYGSPQNRCFPEAGRAWLSNITLDEIERAITIPGLEHGQFTLLSEEWGLRESKSFQFVDTFNRQASPILLAEQLIRHNKTILIRHLQNRSVAVRAGYDHCRAKGLPVRDVVAILSPPESSATVPHADGHAILQLQIYGEKRWRYWETVDDTVIDQAPSVSALEERFRAHAESLPEARATLRPGDMLFLPKRALHTASTTDSFSLSISFQLPGLWNGEPSVADGEQFFDIFAELV